MFQVEAQVLPSHSEQEVYLREKPLVKRRHYTDIPTDSLIASRNSTEPNNRHPNQVLKTSVSSEPKMERQSRMQQYEAANSRRESNPQKFKGVRSLKHKHDKSYQENFKKANTSLVDVQSSMVDGEEDPGRSDGSMHDSLVSPRKMVSVGSYARSSSCPPRSRSKLHSPAIDSMLVKEVKKPVTFFESLINPDPPKPQTKASRYARLAGLPQNRAIENYVGQLEDDRRSRPRRKSLEAGLGPGVSVSELSARFESGNVHNLHGHVDHKPFVSRYHRPNRSSSAHSRGTDSGSPHPTSHPTNYAYYHSYKQDNQVTGVSKRTEPERRRSRSTESPRSLVPVPDALPQPRLPPTSQPVTMSSQPQVNEVC